MKNIFISFLFLSGCARDFENIPSAQTESRFPRIASSKSEYLTASWFEQVDHLNWSVMGSVYSNDTWTEPFEISTDSSFFVNWADFPSLNKISDDTLVAHWLKKSGAGTYDYDIHLSFSYDNGLSWSKSEIPHTTTTKGEHGFVSISIGDKKHDLVWLDGREMLMEHGNNEYGQMNLYHREFTNNGELGSEYLIDPKVCECCPTSSVLFEDTLVVAYRDRSDEEIRDIYIARKTGDTWEPSYPVHNDGWKIAGCPVNGPMLSIRSNQIAIAWYTAANDKAKVYVAYSDDLGKTFSNPIRVDNGMPLGRVDLEWINDDEVLVSWIESSEQSSNIVVRKVKNDLTIREGIVVAEVSKGRISGYPQMEILKDQILFAWTEISTQTSVASKWIPLSKIINH